MTPEFEKATKLMAAIRAAPWFTTLEAEIARPLFCAAYDIPGVGKVAVLLNADYCADPEPVAEPAIDA